MNALWIDSFCKGFDTAMSEVGINRQIMELGQFLT